jgi:LmbE family N-acetylglucosaminyl deacetylase
MDTVVEPFSARSIHGTDETCWQQALADAPPWSPSSGPLLIVSPHPDDEVLGAGGLIHMWKQQGHPVTILSVTDGEAAYPQWRRLGQVRREELKDALQVLCESPVLLVRLGIPDGRIADHTYRLRGAIMSLIAPGATLIAPYESDGHPDHEAAGRVCCEVAQAHGLSIARYPIWTWRHSNPLAMHAARWGRFVLSDAAQAAKADAARCFSSQMLPYKRTPIIPDRIMRYFARPYEAFLL